MAAAPGDAGVQSTWMAFGPAVAAVTDPGIPGTRPLLDSRASIFPASRVPAYTAASSRLPMNIPPVLSHPPMVRPWSGSPAAVWVDGTAGNGFAPSRRPSRKAVTLTAS